jgi:PEP-CTERM motif
MRSLSFLFNRLSARLGLCIALAAAGSAAHASVTWTLNDFSFTDGGKATGSFTWDEQSQVATSWDIVTSEGSAMAAHSYTELTSSMYKTPSVQSITFYVDKLQFRIGLADLALLNAPSAHLDLHSQNPGATGPNGFLECVNCSPYRLGNAGAFLSAELPDTVPEPSTVALTFLVLGLLAVARRKAN